MCPFFCVEPRQPPCKLDVTRNAFNVIEEGLLVWAGQETHLGVAEIERESRSEVTMMPETRSEGHAH